jgi:hypothetical protein
MRMSPVRALGLALCLGVVSHSNAAANDAVEDTTIRNTISKAK